MSVDRIILRIEGGKELPRAEAKRFKQECGSTRCFSMSYIRHPDSEMIDSSGQISKVELNRRYFRMNGTNGGKTLYMERIFV